MRRRTWSAGRPSSGSRWTILKARAARCDRSWRAGRCRGSTSSPCRGVGRRWSLQGFHFQHLQALWTESLIDLYNGQASEAWRRVEERWPALLESLLLRIQVVRIESWYLHGRVALAAGHPAEGKQDAERLRKENIAWDIPLAQLLEAGAAPANAPGVLAAAPTNFEKVEMHLHAAATRHRLGELTNDVAMIAAADEWMTAQRVKNPARLTSVLVPACR